MTDTQYFDIKEKVDILIKKDFGFPSTSENKQWYEETAVKYNQYFNGEDLLLDSIPFNPDFNNNGIVRSASELGLNNSDFKDYYDISSNKSSCSIVDDSTGTVRRIRKLILEECPQLGSAAGSSWFKRDSSNNNIMIDSFQFNFKQYTNNNGATVQPYLYSIFTENSLSTNNPNLPFGSKGGNWNYNVQNGILFFSDFINFSNGVQTKPEYQINTTNNKPVMTFYKYIGKKGISNFIANQVTTNYYNILQIISSNIVSGVSDEIIDSTNYEIIQDLSLNFSSLKDNSNYKILLNFNYLVSSYYDTLLKVALCYKINNQNENIMGEYLLGNENTNFVYDLFSKNFYFNIPALKNDNVNIYLKAKISSNNSTDYTSLDNSYKPKLLLSNPGSCLNIEEINT